MNPCDLSTNRTGPYASHSKLQAGNPADIYLDESRLALGAHTTSFPRNSQRRWMPQSQPSLLNHNSMVDCSNLDSLLVPLQYLGLSLSGEALKLGVFYVVVLKLGQYCGWTKSISHHLTKPWNDDSPANTNQRDGLNRGFKVVRFLDFATIPQ